MPSSKLNNFEGLKGDGKGKVKNKLKRTKSKFKPQNVLPLLSRTTRNDGEINQTEIIKHEGISGIVSNTSSKASKKKKKDIDTKLGEFLDKNSYSADISGERDGDKQTEVSKKKKRKRKFKMSEPEAGFDQSANTSRNSKKKRKKNKGKIEVAGKTTENPNNTDCNIEVDTSRNMAITKVEKNLDIESDRESEKDEGSEIDWDSYPSDTDNENDNKSPILKQVKVNSDESSEESDISGNDSKNSDASEFDMDSYPSDTDDELEKKKGLPINAVPSAEVEEREKRTIFVGNLPYTVERAELKKWFSKFGKVECVRLRSAPIANPEIPRKVAVIKKTFHDSRTNIHAYIRFHTIEAANNAIQANGALFGDHIIRVDHSKHEGKYDRNKGVFVGNVPYAIEEDTLRNVFSECGEIDNVRIVRDKNTGVGKGFAYVNFKCPSSIPIALKLDGELIEKREIRVKPIKYQKKNAKIDPRRFNPKFRHRIFNSKAKNNNPKKTFKPNKFQGETSKRKMTKPHKKKSVVEKKREKLSKIFANKKS